MIDRAYSIYGMPRKEHNIQDLEDLILCMYTLYIHMLDAYNVRGRSLSDIEHGSLSMTTTLISMLISQEKGGKRKRERKNKIIK